MFRPHKGLIQEKNQIHSYPSHIPILSMLVSLSLDKWKRLGKRSTKQQFQSKYQAKKQSFFHF
jgi:hypothetical protein